MRIGSSRTAEERLGVLRNYMYPRPFMPEPFGDVHVMVQQPTVLFLYWMVSDRFLAMLNNYGDGKAVSHLAIRLRMEPDNGTIAGAENRDVQYVWHAQIPADRSQHSTFIEVCSCNALWTAELGFNGNEQRFVPLLHSASVRTGYVTGGAAAIRVSAEADVVKEPLLPANYHLYSTYTIYPQPKQEGELP
ncbi:DUF4912 domain-containing protein [Paenibacillus lutrae]|uniref:DUF4912 domain-containing protein n=1 Tax=Paenibacillus lutrae TaxID=2078573 RepID=A0A7X3FFF0_9BACL|nr:DUF4912 domain-containing protein [Paenibacillus lutrae]MVO98755.1 DUF4912 domain-containing protein [Paenibacillus lutrae]